MKRNSILVPYQGRGSRAGSGCGAEVRGVEKLQSQSPPPWLSQFREDGLRGT